jgi:probable rRNA maturation factor
MAIEFHQENVLLSDFNEELNAQWLFNTIEKEGFSTGDINVIFCDDEYLLGMNQQYLQHDYYTDIITFDYSEDGLISGDLFISFDRVKDNAASLSIDFDQELKRVMVHGILHLCGYGDKSPEDKEKMTAMENLYLELRKA